MSAWRWTECPKGCDNGDMSVDENERKQVARLDISYGFTQERAYVRLNMECEICGLKVELKDEKKAKLIVREMRYE